MSGPRERKATAPPPIEDFRPEKRPKKSHKAKPAWAAKRHGGGGGAGGGIVGGGGAGRRRRRRRRRRRLLLLRRRPQAADPDSEPIPPPHTPQGRRA